jgi:hypothetical protein
MLSVIASMVGLPLAVSAMAADLPVARPPALPAEDIVADRLHDRRIEIFSTSCRHWVGCRTYRISLDRDGRGEMRFDRDGKPNVRAFIMTPYAFRKLQIILEPFRPISSGEESEDDCCAEGMTYEITRVEWESDHTTRQYFVRQTSRPRRDGVDDALFRAQNLLLRVLAPAGLADD